MLRDPRLQSDTVTDGTRECEATIAGTRTRWWEYGDGGDTVIAVHGFRGDHHGLQRVIDRLPEYRILSPDLPGYGGSTTLAEPHSIPAYADWLIDFVTATAGGRRPFTILAHSFGTIVTAAAIDRGLSPDRVVLINPIATSPLAGIQAIGTTLVRGLYRLGAVLPHRLGDRLLRARLITDGMSVLTTTTRDRELRRWIKAEHRRYFAGFRSRRVVVEGFEASLSDHVTPHAAAFTMPTLLIAAGRDQITPIADVRGLRERMPDAQLVELEGVGHLIHYERPAEAAEAIRAFLAAQVRT